ncbi:MAG TPA: malto-oligosyltrehalose synthase [Longimicrobiales bacterium]
MIRRPASTYRVQLNAGFRFDDATAIVPYLRRLGIDWLYASPILQARAGSTHGYDVTDPRRINPELGDEAALRRLSDALHDARMGLLLDIVPNHAAADTSNPMWLDVLARGAQSEFAHVFDILWDDDGRVLLPILGGELDDVVARGELTVDRSGPQPVLRYFDRELPLRDADAVRGDDADALRALLDRQAYRLAFWRRAASDINYRRFFDVSDLVGMRQEDERVFELTHALVAQLVEQGIVSGVRVDHVDGLLDPSSYLARLKHRLFPGTSGYVVVEKITERDERLPGDWPVDGTTGYDYVNQANGLSVSIAGLAKLTGFYARFTGANVSFDDVVFRRKLQVQEELFGAELSRLVELIGPLLGVEVEPDVARLALAAVTAGMPRYRTYFARDRVRPEDRDVVTRSVREARERQPDVPAAAYDAIERVLAVADTPASVDRDRLDFVMRWQQYTGPVMAKGHEDTAMYVYNRLLAANAVGGDPADPIATTTDFHRWLIERRDWVGAMNAGSTHDSKRSEDVRARIDAITEIADDAIAAIERWHAMNGPLAANVGGQRVPDANTEILLYQTLVGAWPLERADEDAFVDRLCEYLTKATREAKTFTSWIEPNEAWEGALHEFVRNALAPAHGFRDDLRSFVDRIAPAGALVSLAQLLLRIAAPGVPDFYQGTELWTFTLVDPDNRRPVDYEARARMLDEVEPLVTSPTAAGAAELLRDWRTGAIRMFVTSAALRDRMAHPRLYLAGEHHAVEGFGPLAAHVCGFARRFGGEWRVCIVPLRVEEAKARAGGAHAGRLWSGTTAVLPPGAPARWRNRLTGEVVEARDGELALDALFASLPLALLEPV